MDRRREQLWRRVEERLDLRLDPFGDEELRVALSADPELEAATRRLLLRLDGLRTTAGPSPGQRLAQLARSAAAVLALASGVGLLIHALSAGRPADPRDGSILFDCELVIEHLRPEPPRLRRRVVESTRVMAWTLEGTE